ncbi:PREDICTED: C-C motif chemokine 20-like isoform X2 [Cyprinodon variegatus]|uniref:C-C motif chemokine 20-like isoform X2 n=1 Tax=Cyprinodon variegatus TaxID=28743 RepID=UPI0007425704|nr:PREDICTED: C-C motif chemokine 20-like isoform X2 [Cyprinodon variegatus]
MTLRSIMVFIIPLFIIVGVLSPGICSWRDCCKRYDDKVVNIRHIRGYCEQRKQGDCIKAIIFYTTNYHEVCANPEDEWVKDTLKRLG